MTAYCTNYEGAINYPYIGSSAIIVQHLRISVIRRCCIEKGYRLCVYVILRRGVNQVKVTAKYA